jgi:tetratricopeptide (TPR) repeat protein/polyferredoxin
VYLLFGFHIAHWKIAGKTLAPLELNEVMYTLELGIVTAGFLFMCIAFLSTAIFGRFFCSWGCHILALEDLCAWLLRRIGIRPRPVRSRLLLLVPPSAMFYMFLWPQVSRVFHGQPLPQWKVLHDAEGWASFTTTHFWRNLPGPWITVLTFAVCGFIIVYLLGTRSFCKYACPYGAVFGLADRFAPGKIVASGNCESCGVCTAACQSNIRVHEELQSFGKVVSTSCLKDLDCVSACPNDAIRYGFTKPSLFKSRRRPPHLRVRYDLTLGEELLTILVFLATLFIFRGLYHAVPFIMTLGLGGVLAYVAVLSVRLAGRQNLRLNNFQLKREGRLTAAGLVFAAGVFALTTLVAHSAFVRYHEYSGDRAYERVIQIAGSQSTDDLSALLAGAVYHLELCDRWGLFHPALLDERLATLQLLAESQPEAQEYLQRVRRRDPAAAHELVARYLANRGDLASAEAAYESALAADRNRVSSHLELAGLLGNQGRFPEGVEQLEAAIQIQPDSAVAHYNLAVLLTQLGRETEAIAHYRTARDLAPNDPEIRNNLGLLLARRGELDAAAEQFRKAIQLNPYFAHPHFNLGRILLQQGRIQEAEAHLLRATQLDPMYARLLSEAPRNRIQLP